MASYIDVVLIDVVIDVVRVCESFGVLSFPESGLGSIGARLGSIGAPVSLVGVYWCT